MNPDNAGPIRIELPSADDLRDVVHRAVEILTRGGLVGVPTDVGYACAASGLQPEAVHRLVQISEPGNRWIMTRGSAELEEFVPQRSALLQRGLAKCWPGPVAFRVVGANDGALRQQQLSEEVTSALIENGAITVRSPAHSFIIEVDKLLVGPLILVELFGPQSDPLETAEELNPGWFQATDLLIDDGRSLVSGGPAIIEVQGESCTLKRESAQGEEAYRAICQRSVLFVCTGNTCRSPMAEAIFRSRLANRLDCPQEELGARGWSVGSAGIWAFNGHPAAANAVEIVHRFGADLHHHESRRLTAAMVQQADLIVVMTREHFDTLTAAIPEASDRTRLLDPEGYDLADPVGQDLDRYQSTAETIDLHLDSLLNELEV